MLGSYRFDKYLTDDRGRRPATTTFIVRPPVDAVAADSERAFARARSTARAVSRARDLVNEPAGTLTPTALAETASAWAREAGLSVEVFDRAGCAALGMGLYLAVAQGSTQEPRFIHLAWTPPGARRRIVIVGKGITFDSGGLSLKTNEGMLDMKTDMAGAAAVLAAAASAAEEKLPVEVHALAACTENMPSGNAYKLGDVIRSLDGKTVEINNTDAEGRLTLADALSFGLRFKPDAVLDFATLTGACMVALGPHTAGVMSNDDALAGELLDAAATRRRGDVAVAVAAAALGAAEVRRRRLQEHGRALGRRADGGIVPAGVRARRSVGARRHRGPVERRQGVRAHCEGRNGLRGGRHSGISASRRNLSRVRFASQPKQITAENTARASAHERSGCVDSGRPA